MLDKRQQPSLRKLQSSQSYRGLLLSSWLRHCSRWFMHCFIFLWLLIAGQERISSSTKCYLRKKTWEKKNYKDLNFAKKNKKVCQSVLSVDCTKFYRCNSAQSAVEIIPQTCSPNSICIPNDQNQPSCVCLNGYTGDGITCRQNPCFSNPCKNGATCSSSGSSFVCKCAPGFLLPTCATSRMCLRSIHFIFYCITYHYLQINKNEQRKLNVLWTIWLVVEIVWSVN